LPEKELDSMADRTLRTTVHIGGTAYAPGTAEADIAPEHREGITNPDVWAGTEDQGDVIVQSAPVFDLPAEPGEGLASGYDPADAGQVAPSDEAPAASKKAAQKRTEAPK
jgi:hypothetical protein